MTTHLPPCSPSSFDCLLAESGDYIVTVPELAQTSVLIIGEGVTLTFHVCHKPGVVLVPRFLMAHL